MIVNARFKLLRGPAATWTNKNPTLQNGEPGYEDDTSRLKIGDGTTAWNDLPFLQATTAWGSIDGTLSDQIDLQAALDEKLSLSGGELLGPLSDVTLAGTTTLPGGGIIDSSGFVSGGGASAWTIGAKASVSRIDCTSGEFRFLAETNTTAPIIAAYASFPQIGTTASASNAYLDTTSTPANRILRSTSARRYKRDIEEVSPAYAEAILSLRPVWYRSCAEADNPEWGWWGLVAEEVAEVDPRLVHWGYMPEDYETDASGEAKLRSDAAPQPVGVQYERLSVLLLSLTQQTMQRLTVLEEAVGKLTAQAGN